MRRRSKNLIENKSELNHAINSFINEIKVTKKLYINNNVVIATDRFSNFERSIKCKLYKIENHNFHCIVNFYNTVDKIEHCNYIGISITIGLINDKFGMVDAITRIRYLDVMSELLYTSEITSALTKLCDIAIEMLEEIQNQYEDFNYNRARINNEF